MNHMLLIDDGYTCDSIDWGANNAVNHFIMVHDKVNWEAINRKLLSNVRKILMCLVGV